MSDKPEKVEHPLNSPKCRLSAPNPSVPGKYATLSFDIYGGNPRLVLSPNDPSRMSPEKGFGKVQAALDLPTFYVFLELLKTAISGPAGNKTKLENFGTVKGGEVAHLTDIWVGRDAQGVVFVSVIGKREGLPFVEFKFGPADERFHFLKKSDGSVFSKAEVSAVYANGYIAMLTQTMAGIAVKSYVKPAPYVPQGKGGYSKGGYGNQGQSSSGSDYPY